MIYSDEEMILFSLIYSDVEEGRFARPHLSHKALYSIFWQSISDELNIFAIDNTRNLKELFSNAIKKLKELGQIREEEKYLDELNSYFIENKARFLSLKEKIGEEIQLCELHNIKYKTYFSDGYPISLKELKDPPFVIYYKGYLPKNSELERSLAIIGTRNPDEKYGREVAKRTGEMLTNSGWWNISGLAVGCDEYGHIGSLNAGGATGAILAHGLAQPIFPKENNSLAEDILAKDGFLLSEIPPSIKLSSIFLVLRDRLQSGMTKGIFVVETSEKSGTLHTVKYSLEQNRFTLVWDPSNIKDLSSSIEINGNLILLEKKKGTLSPNVPKKLFSNIIGIETSKFLKDKLEEIEKKKFKIISGNESKSIEKEPSFEQANLFKNIK